MCRRVYGVGAALLTVILSLGPAAAAASREPARMANLAGSWTLQPDRSEPPKAPQRTAGPPSGGPGGAGGGPPGGGPPGGGPPGGMGGGRGGPGGMDPPTRPPTQEELTRMRAAVLEAVDPAPALRIAQTSDDVTIGVGDAQGVTFITDGKKRKQPSSLGAMQTKARWKDDRLIVETSLEGGLKTTRTLWIDATSATRALVIQIKVEGGKLPNAVQARYVYHAAKT
jgi:hypothetical protein